MYLFELQSDWTSSDTEKNAESQNPAYRISSTHSVLYKHVNTNTAYV